MILLYQNINMGCYNESRVELSANTSGQEWLPNDCIQV